MPLFGDYQCFLSRLRDLRAQSLTVIRLHTVIRLYVYCAIIRAGRANDRKWRSALAEFITLKTEIPLTRGKIHRHTCEAVMERKNGWFIMVERWIHSALCRFTYITRYYDQINPFSVAARPALWRCTEKNIQKNKTKQKKCSQFSILFLGWSILNSQSRNQKQKSLA